MSCACLPAFLFHQITNRPTDDLFASEYCTRNMKIFTHEHMLYTPAQLRVHIERGDVNLNTPVQKGFTGHPQCEFCRIRCVDYFA